MSTVHEQLLATLQAMDKDAHLHRFDSSIDYFSESSLIPSILGCRCGVFAAVGEGEILPMGNPHHKGESNAAHF